jgi:hypothetical protein
VVAAAQADPHTLRCAAADVCSNRHGTSKAPAYSLSLRPGQASGSRVGGAFRHVLIRLPRVAGLSRRAGHGTAGDARACDTSVPLHVLRRSSFEETPTSADPDLVRPDSDPSPIRGHCVRAAREVSVLPFRPAAPVRTERLYVLALARPPSYDAHHRRLSRTSKELVLQRRGPAGTRMTSSLLLAGVN